MACESDEELADDPIKLFYDDDDHSNTLVFNSNNNSEDETPASTDLCNEEFRSSYGQKTFVLPVTFFDVYQNIRLLKECKPLSIKVVDCDLHPWYYEKKFNSLEMENDYNYEVNIYADCMKITENNLVVNTSDINNKDNEINDITVKRMADEVESGKNSKYVEEIKTNEDKKTCISYEADQNDLNNKENNSEADKALNNQCDANNLISKKKEQESKERNFVDTRLIKDPVVINSFHQNDNSIHTSTLDMTKNYERDLLTEENESNTNAKVNMLQKEPNILRKNKLILGTLKPKFSIDSKPKITVTENQNKRYKILKSMLQQERVSFDSNTLFPPIGGTPNKTQMNNITSDSKTCSTFDLIHGQQNMIHSPAKIQRMCCSGNIQTNIPKVNYGPQPERYIYSDPVYQNHFTKHNRDYFTYSTHNKAYCNFKEILNKHSLWKSKSKATIQNTYSTLSREKDKNNTNKPKQVTSVIHYVSISDSKFRDSPTYTQMNIKPSYENKSCLFDNQISPSSSSFKSSQCCPNLTYSLVPRNVNNLSSPFDLAYTPFSNNSQCTSNFNLKNNNNDRNPKNASLLDQRIKMSTGGNLIEENYNLNFDKTNELTRNFPNKDTFPVNYSAINNTGLPVNRSMEYVRHEETQSIDTISSKRVQQQQTNNMSPTIQRVPTQTGYSPPILPIITYENALKMYGTPSTSRAKLAEKSGNDKSLDCSKLEFKKRKLDGFYMDGSKIKHASKNNDKKDTKMSKYYFDSAKVKCVDLTNESVSNDCFNNFKRSFKRDVSQHNIECVDLGYDSDVTVCL